MIRLINVSKTYNPGKKMEVQALSSVDVTAKSGLVTAIVGPSGSGKSTLLNIAGCLECVTKGALEIDGNSVGELNEGKILSLRREYFGYMPQELGLLPDRNVLENVFTPLLFNKVKWNKIKETANNALRIVGIEEYAYRRIDQLSGGQRQRVALARALVSSSKCIIVDEPTAALDSDTALKIISVLLEQAKKGKIVLIATHDPIIYERCDTVIRLRDGKIISV